MTGRAIMLQGTGSDVGKSLLVAALCRLAVRRGLRVAPFKAQNMSNNAAACPGGGEIGRAQALQARAAGLPPHPDMNPVLLKPQTDRSAQVVVQGEVRSTLEATDYVAARESLLEPVVESFHRLAAQVDLVLVEGAGSPAEINLRRGDIANMGFARRLGVPVCLVGDIDRGGVIASLVGTKAVIDPADAELIRACLINRFRGDRSLFAEGVVAIERLTGWPCLGVVPWLAAASQLPAEDALGIAADTDAHDRDALRVVAPMLSRIANFDDADPLRREPGVDFQWIPPGRPLPRDADVVMLFGTKSTLGDLAFLRAQGWDIDIQAHVRAGGRVLGLCGGFQMLGHWIRDPEGVDGSPGDAPGLGLLDVDTVMRADKRVSPAQGRCARSAVPINGYEIHSGRTEGPATARPMFLLGDTPDGARSPDGRIAGTYLHGIFDNDSYRRRWLAEHGASGDPTLAFDAAIETALDAVADGVADAVDLERFFALAQQPQDSGPGS